MQTRSLEILDGPGFRELVIEGGVVPKSGWDNTFKMDQGNPENNSQSYQMTVVGIGKVKPNPGEKNEDLYWFIGRKAHPYNTKLIPKIEDEGIMEHEMRRWFTDYYVGQYNVRTRKGRCTEVHEKDFFALNPLMKLVMLS